MVVKQRVNLRRSSFLSWDKSEGETDFHFQPVVKSCRAQALPWCLLCSSLSVDTWRTVWFSISRILECHSLYFQTLCFLHTLVIIKLKRLYFCFSTHNFVLYFTLIYMSHFCIYVYSWKQKLMTTKAENWLYSLMILSLVITVLFFSLDVNMWL